MDGLSQQGLRVSAPAFISWEGVDLENLKNIKSEYRSSYFRRSIAWNYSGALILTLILWWLIFWMPRAGWVALLLPGEVVQTSWRALLQEDLMMPLLLFFGTVLDYDCLFQSSNVASRGLYSDLYHSVNPRYRPALFVLLLIYAVLLFLAHQLAYGLLFTMLVAKLIPVSLHSPYIGYLLTLPIFLYTSSRFYHSLLRRLSNG